MNKVSKDELYNLYCVQKIPMHLISKKLGIAIGTVFNYLKKYNIKTRNKDETFNFTGRKHTEKTKEKLSEINKGKVLSKETKDKISKAHTRKGIGHKKTRTDGYVAIYFPDNPSSNKEGYVMEHDLIMSCYLGRKLNPNEVVHHINRNRSDNRIENLKLMTFKEHARFHMLERHNKRSDDLSIK